MTFKLLDSGAWVTAKELHVASGGAFASIRKGSRWDGSEWQTIFQKEIAVTLASTTNVTISSLFSAGDWASTAPKRVIIPADAIIGSTSTSAPALRTGTGWSGKLAVEIHGQILGAGGPANGGAGGPALLAEQAGIEIYNAGEIKGGGIGGGPGGQGGPGYYYVYTTEGPYFSLTPPETYYYNGTIWWFGNVYSQGQDGWTYSQGAPGGSGAYYILRTKLTSTGYSTGGAGGAGGRGRGYNQTPLNGSPGSAGGTNAGLGGTGGAGGEWGLAGATGSTGASGNNGAGSPGSPGGTPGAAILNPGYVDLINTGTLAGAH